MENNQNYEVIIAKSNNEFIEYFKKYLIKYKMEMQLYHLNLTNSDMELEKENIRGGVIRDGEVSLIFLNAFPFNLQIKSFDKDINSFDLLAKFIIENDIDIRGIEGTLDDAKQFINSYNLIKIGDFRFEHTMDIMRLDKLNDVITNPEGRIEIATMDDFFIVRDYTKKMHLEAMNENTPDEILDARVKAFINNKGTYLYYNKDNIITSIVNISPTPKGAYRISLVYTEKKYRNNNYAKEMLYLLIKKLAPSGNIFTLFVDKLNPISNKLYRDLGFYVVEDNVDVRIIKK